jgi:hypothetical protein
MARRIVLTMLALIGALLVTTVVPLGLITTGHEGSSFREDTVLSARALAGLAEDRLADRPPARTGAVARALAQAQRAGDQVRVHNAARRLITGTGGGQATVTAARWPRRCRAGRSCWPTRSTRFRRAATCRSARPPTGTGPGWWWRTTGRE